MELALPGCTRASWVAVVGMFWKVTPLHSTPPPPGRLSSTGAPSTTSDVTTLPPRTSRVRPAVAVSSGVPTDGLAVKVPSTATLLFSVRPPVAPVMSRSLNWLVPVPKPGLAKVTTRTAAAPSSVLWVPLAAKLPAVVPEVWLKLPPTLRYPAVSLPPVKPPPKIAAPVTSTESRALVIVSVPLPVVLSAALTTSVWPLAVRSPLPLRVRLPSTVRPVRA